MPPMMKLSVFLMRAVGQERELVGQHLVVCVRPAEVQRRVLVVELVRVIQRKAVRSIIRLVAEAELRDEPMRAIASARWRHPWPARSSGLSVTGSLFCAIATAGRPALRSARDAVELPRVSGDRRGGNRRARRRVAHFQLLGWAARRSASRPKSRRTPRGSVKSSHGVIVLSMRSVSVCTWIRPCSSAYVWWLTPTESSARPRDAADAAASSAPIPSAWIGTTFACPLNLRFSALAPESPAGE